MVNKLPFQNTCVFRFISLQVHTSAYKSPKCMTMELKERNVNLKQR